MSALRAVLEDFAAQTPMTLERFDRADMDQAYADGVIAGRLEATDEDHHRLVDALIAASTDAQRLNDACREVRSEAVAQVCDALAAALTRIWPAIRADEVTRIVAAEIAQLDDADRPACRIIAPAQIIERLHVMPQLRDLRIEMGVGDQVEVRVNDGRVRASAEILETELFRFFETLRQEAQAA